MDILRPTQNLTFELQSVADISNLMLDWQNSEIFPLNSQLGKTAMAIAKLPTIIYVMPLGWPHERDWRHNTAWTSCHLILVNVLPSGFFIMYNKREYILGGLVGGVGASIYSDSISPTHSQYCPPKWILHNVQ